MDKKGVVFRLVMVDNIDDFLIWVILGVIVGGWFGYVLFY